MLGGQTMAIKITTPEPGLSGPPTLVHQSTHKPLRVTLIVLAAIVALSAILGAIFVVPTMPTSVLHQGVIALFSDFTIPALALGVLCGGGALVALIAVVLRPRLGGLLSMVAGIFMVGFELVEIMVVGFTPVQTPSQPQAWLQVFYLAIGTLIAVLGWRLWRAEQEETQTSR
jgi:hypothetical protein